MFAHRPLSKSQSAAATQPRHIIVLPQLKRDSNGLHAMEAKESNMNQNNRRIFSTEQKATILRRHLIDKVPASTLCEEYKLQPSVFYTWQKQLIENMGAWIMCQRLFLD
jgi:transposase-like protein